ncbi:hypothetical protein, partial [Pseudoalteromonas sp. RB2-MNA-CIBAN-0110]
MKLNRITSSLINKQHKSNPALISAAALILMTSSTLAAQESENTSATADKNIEVIEVKGILNSMKAAAMLKRTDGRIV